MLLFKRIAVLRGEEEEDEEGTLKEDKDKGTKSAL